MSITSSKKGFTLVELVVTIAIIAILAAIAIPAVTGIVSGANNSTADANAAALDMACKDFFTGVSTGTITKDNAFAVSPSKLPAKSDPLSTKQNIAKNLTVKEAVAYAGVRLQHTFPDDASLSDFQFDDADGTVTYKGENGALQTGHTQLTIDTKLKDMYKNV